MALMNLNTGEHLQRRPTHDNLNTNVGRFTARYNFLNSGLGVVAYESSPGVWEVTPYPGLETLVGGGDQATPGVDDINTASFVFYGGQQYEIDDIVLATALQDAGYPFLSWWL